MTSAASTTFTLGSPGSFTMTATGLPTPTLSETGTLPGRRLVQRLDRCALRHADRLDRDVPDHAEGVQRRRVGCHPELHAHGGQPAGVHEWRVDDLHGRLGRQLHGRRDGLPGTDVHRDGLPAERRRAQHRRRALRDARGRNRRQLPDHDHRHQLGRHREPELHAHGRPERPRVASVASTTFTVASAGSFTATATGFPAPTFSETGTLPTGVTLSSAGALTGTPAAGTSGTYPITITAGNGVGSNATQSFTLTVNLFTIGGIQFIQVAPINGTYTCTASAFTSVSCTAAGTAGTNLTGHIELFTGSGGYGYPETPTATNTSGSPITITSSSVTLGGTPNPASFTIPTGSADSNDVMLVHNGPNNVWTFSYTLNSTVYTLTVTVS